MPEKSARMAEDYQWLMFDSMPFCCALWNEKIKRLDCNLETVKLLGYKDKQEFLNNSFDIFTEYQPDGSPSVEKCVEMLKMTLIKGHSVFELVVKTLRGDLIPAEITLVKVNLKNEHVAVAAYLRDLREIKAAGNKAAMAYKRTQTILDAALVCCHLWDKDLKIIDCNIEALKLFELSSKEEYAERYFELSPEHQPDGQPSKLKIIAMVKLAFDTGRSVFELVVKTLRNDLIPAEITLV
ncbi:MAG: PAS domain-containing protein, partial [Holophagales bacterium]|nr:PAS domain-containing protein [Holophagales bacterium]